MHKLTIILVEPQQPGNIGMVCRAMANFGVSELRLVNPCEHRHPEARKFAVAAGQLLDGAKVFATLSEALANLQLSVATTRRTGRFRGELLDSTALPQRLAALPTDAKIGLVFGREDAGLTSEEVATCSLAATVATSSAQGSLNLAQAVLLFLYELARQPQHTAADAARELPPQAELDGLFRQIDAVLERIAFSNPSRPEAVRHRVRQLFNRIGPDKEEVAFLRGMWSQIASSVNDWKGRRRG